MDASEEANNLLKEEDAARKRKIQEKKEEDGVLRKESFKPVSFECKRNATNSFADIRVHVPWSSINNVDAPRDRNLKGQVFTNDRVRDKS